MNWFKKILLVVVSLLLFISLLGGALFIGLNRSLGSESNAKQWVDQSDFYGGLVDSLISQAQESVDNNNTLSISFQDDSVRQAVQTALPKSTVDEAVNTFLSANYAWLKGETSTPEFTIDLTSSKQAFATQLATEAKTRLSGLSACNTSQLLALQSQQTTNPFTIDCLPPGVDPAVQANSLQNRITQSNVFLVNPLITATALNPNGSNDTNSEPYYEALSIAPSAYQASRLAPFILGVVALLSAIAIVFIAQRKRYGLRIIGIICIFSGLLLLITKLFIDQATHKITTTLTSSNEVGQLQSTLSSILDKAFQSTASSLFMFGVGLAILGVVLIIIAAFNRKRRQPIAPMATSETNMLPPIVKSSRARPTRPKLIQ